MGIDQAGERAGAAATKRGLKMTIDVKTIKCITLWQPWASLIMIGAKPWEFRSWSYVARGVGVRPGDTVGIHASAPIKTAEILDLIERLDDPLCSTGLIPAISRPLLERLAAAHKCRGVIETSRRCFRALPRSGAPQVECGSEAGVGRADQR